MGGPIAALLILIMIIILAPVVSLELEILSHFHGRLYSLFAPLERQKKSRNPEGAKYPKCDLHVNSNRNTFMKENLVEEVCGCPKYRVLNCQVNRGADDSPVKIEIDITLHSDSIIDQFENTPAHEC